MFRRLIENPFVWIFLAFGPIAYGGGKGMIILMGILFLSLGTFLFFNKKKPYKISWIPFLKNISLPLWLLFVLWGYMSLSIFWSLNPLGAFSLSVRLLGTLILGICSLFWIGRLSKEILRHCLLFLLISWGGLFCILFCDVLTQKILKLPIHSLFPFKTWDSLTKQNLLLSLFFWPTCGFFIFFSHLKFFASLSFSRKKILFLSLGVLVLLLTLFLPMRAASIALILGLIGYQILNRYPQALTSILGSLIGGGFLFPILHIFFLNSNPLSPYFISAPFLSWQHRIFIWNFTYEKIKLHPFIGWGLDASRSIPREMGWMSFKESGIVSQHLVSPLSSHPHNAFFQMWLEGGAIGALLLACLLFSFVMYIKKTYASIHDRALLGSMFISFLTPFYVSFGVWQTWWITTLCFTIILWEMIKKIK